MLCILRSSRRGSPEAHRWNVPRERRDRTHLPLALREVARSPPTLAKDVLLSSLIVVVDRVYPPDSSMATIEPRTANGKSGTCLIRSATLEDAPELLKLQHRLCSETEFLSRMPEEITLTVDQQRQRIADATAADRALFCVAVVANQIVGSTNFHARPLARFRHQGEIGIAVVQDYWGHGISRALLGAILDWTDSVGVIRVSLVVCADNVRAIELYEHFGFIVEGRLRNEVRLTAGLRDSLAMARVIDPS